MAKRGRKPKNPEDKNYFQATQEQAIIDFIKEEDEAKKNKIYNEKLKPAFKKMIESIIRRYKLFIPDEDFADTFNDTLSYLLTKIQNFNPERGTKAYSYCGTVAKNYLIYKNIQYSKNLVNSVPYDTMSTEIYNSPQYIDYGAEDDSMAQAKKLIAKMQVEIQDMIDNPSKYRLTQSEIVVGRAIIELFNNWDVIVKSKEDEDSVSTSNKLCKSSILYFLREETMMTTLEVRNSMKTFKRVYYEIKKELQNADEE